MLREKTKGHSRLLSCTLRLSAYVYDWSSLKTAITAALQSLLHATPCKMKPRKSRSNSAADRPLLFMLTSLKMTTFCVFQWRQAHVVATVTWTLFNIFHHKTTALSPWFTFRNLHVMQHSMYHGSTLNLSYFIQGFFGLQWASELTLFFFLIYFKIFYQ